MAKIGRPTTRTPEVEAIIMRSLAEGASLRSAAKIAGISWTALKEWRVDDPSFASRTDQARTNATHAVSMALRTAALNGNVGAMTFWLSRRCPDFAESALAQEAQDDGETSETSVRRFAWVAVPVDALPGNQQIPASPAPTEQAGGC